MKLLFLQTILLLTIILNTQAQRGRVQIQDGTIVTDKGTLLRGAFVSINSPWDVMPSREQISAIKDFGLNGIHLYGESYWDINRGDPGYLLDKVDSIVAWTAQDSLYLVLTFAGLDINNDTNVTFVKECWEIYAERYKDETHVIFEILNEPILEMPFPEEIIMLEKELYDTIRAHASETHIQFMSYPFTIKADSAILNIKDLGEGIDWSNASIAAHGYTYSSEESRYFIKTLKDSGYAVTITEVPVIRYDNYASDFYVNLAFTRIYEEDFVSYFHFLTLDQVLDNPGLFKEKIESCDIRWSPDFGIWPANLSGIDYINPFKPIKTGFCDESNKGIYYSDAYKLFIIDTFYNHDTYIAFFNLNFPESADSIILTFSYLQQVSRVEVRLDSHNGTLLCNASIPPVNEDTPTDFSFPAGSFEGIHKIYLVFKSSTYVAGIIDRIQFKTNYVTSTDNLIPRNIPVFFYPNPASDYLIIRSPVESSLEIWTMQGQLLYSKKLYSTKQTILVDQLKPGNYIVKLVSKSEVSAEILIIE